MKKLLIRILLVMCLGVFVFAGWKLYSTMQEYKRGEEIYEEVLDRSVTENTEDETNEPPISVDFAQLQAEYPNVVGWIYCEGTIINYPVVQGEDNSYYLKHAYDGTRSSNGAIFLDYHNNSDFSDPNTIIYGHNMKNDTMFAGLVQYADQSYYDEHPIMWLLTPEHAYKLLIFSGYTGNSQSDAYTLFSAADEEFHSYVSKRIELSDFQATVSPDESDRIVTLSTCAYSTKNARYIVHAILQQFD